MLTKPYPKDNEARTMGLPADLVAQLADWITTRRLGPDDLLFATREGTPISRNTFRTRVWLPAVKASGVDFDVRVHDLRHAHASWLLAGGSDLKSVMDRMGHAQITTTQKYLHALPDADAKNLDALNRTRGQHRAPAAVNTPTPAHPRTLTATTRRPSSRHPRWPIPAQIAARPSGEAAAGRHTDRRSDRGDGRPVHQFAVTAPASGLM